MDNYNKPYNSKGIKYLMEILNSQKISAADFSSWPSFLFIISSLFLVTSLTLVGISLGSKFYGHDCSESSFDDTKQNQVVD